jgi:uncharacterized protein YndB with AHSA1/START domain
VTVKSGNIGVIRLERLYTQSPDRLWRALTEPEYVARWWAPGDIRAQVGHRFDMDMGPWGKQPCEVLAVEHERLFSYRFAEPTLNTIITWTLAPEGTGTRLTLVHEGFDLDSPMSRRAYEGMKPGWPGILERIATAVD